MEREKRIAWIDALKGIAIIGVIIGHSGLEHEYTYIFQWQILIFFILSGWTFKPADITSAWLKNKFERLMIPYFWTCLAVTLMDIVNHIVLHSQGRITAIIYADVVRTFFASGGNTAFGTYDAGYVIGTVWFLPALFFSLVFAQIIQKNFTGYYRYLVGAVLLLTAVITQGFFWLPFSIQSGMAAAVFIIIGFDLKNNNILDKISARGTAGLFILYLVLATLHFGCHFVSASFEDIFLSSAAGISACVVLMKTGWIFERSRALCWAGRHSLEILCVHLFTVDTMGHWIGSAVSRLCGSSGMFAFGTDAWKRLCLIVSIAFIFIVSYVLTIISHISKKRIEAAATGTEIESGRIPSVDLMKGIIIVTMIIGHLDIDLGFRTLIYSMHMPAFVILSGLFDKERKIKDQVKKDISRLLIPYLIFAVCDLAMTFFAGNASLKDEFIKVVLGLSFTKGILTGLPCLGAVYFILMLFCVKIAYSILQNVVHDELRLSCWVIALSFCGIILGGTGCWLPWSFDVALYCLVYYHFAHLIYKHGLLDGFLRRPYLYFAIASVWAYMIWCGGMEIALRKYAPYTIVVLGAFAGSGVVLLICHYLTLHFSSSFINRIIVYAGRSTMWILIIHVLCRRPFGSLFGYFISDEHILHKILVLAATLLAGMMANKIWELLTKKKAAAAAV